ncbi:SRPBCC family protein [Amycolatopsis sp. NPDC058986]|uniref:SRPBCC family protein n=1 Tax=unclassified Amycolatopsis TaxID=2618356 RepID=UPI00366D4480
MILDHEVAVAAPPEAVFAALTDVGRIVPCLPGAAIEGSDGDTHRGRVQVKVGPISAAYQGTVRFLEVDERRRYLRLQAAGNDVHGSGDAEAQVEVTVAESPDGAVLRLTTDLLIRGKIAQFGKGAIGAVAGKLLGQFAGNLAGLLDPARPAAPPSATASPSAAAVQSELDGLALVLGPAAKYAPVIGAFAVGLFQGWLLGKLRAQSKELKRRG